VKKVIILLQLLCFIQILHAQSKVENTDQFLKILAARPDIDSLKGLLTTNLNNETRAIILFQLVTSYIDNNLDSSLKYVKQFNQVPSKPKVLEANGFVIMGDIFLRLGNVSMALGALFDGTKIFEDLNDPTGIGMAYWNIGKVYQSLDDNTKAVSYYTKAMEIASSTHNPVPLSRSMGALGFLYMNINLDSALYFTQSAYDVATPTYRPFLLAQLGAICQKSGDTNLAMKYYRTALEKASSKHNLAAASEACIGLAMLFKKRNMNDSDYYYARKGFMLAQQLNSAALILKAGDSLKVLFKDKNLVDSAFKYQEMMIFKTDSLEKINGVYSISLAVQQRIQQTEAQKKELQTKIKLYTLIFSLAVFIYCHRSL